MTRDELEIGRFYACGGEPVYKLEDVGTDWVLVLHYSTVHYVANPEFIRLEKFLSDFHQEDDDWMESLFSNDLVYNEDSSLWNKDYS